MTCTYSEEYPDCQCKKCQRIAKYAEAAQLSQPLPYEQVMTSGQVTNVRAETDHQSSLEADAILDCSISRFASRYPQSGISPFLVSETIGMFEIV